MSLGEMPVLRKQVREKYGGDVAGLLVRAKRDDLRAVLDESISVAEFQSRVNAVKQQPSAREARDARLGRADDSRLDALDNIGPLFEADGGEPNGNAESVPAMSVPKLTAKGKPRVERLPSGPRRELVEWMLSRPSPLMQTSQIRTGPATIPNTSVFMLELKHKGVLSSPERGVWKLDRVMAKRWLRGELYKVGGSRNQHTAPHEAEAATQLPAKRAYTRRAVMPQQQQQIVIEETEPSMPALVRASLMKFCPECGKDISRYMRMSEALNELEDAQLEAIVAVSMKVMKGRKTQR